MKKNADVAQRPFCFDVTNSIGQRFWLRVYHRGDTDLYLCNFLMSEEVKRRLYNILPYGKVDEYKDAEMTCFTARREAAVKVTSISELLQKCRVIKGNSTIDIYG